MIIRKLPHWVLTNKLPGFYDTDSGSTIEQTALVYRKMQELIDNYNIFVDDTNNFIEDFVTSSNSNYEEFTMAMEQKFHNFIKTCELKFDSQDMVIQDAVSYMKTNLVTTTQELIREMFQNNEITIDFTYNPSTESLELNGVIVHERSES